MRFAHFLIRDGDFLDLWKSGRLLGHILGARGAIVVELDRASPTISILKTLLQGGNPHGLGHLALRTDKNHRLLALRALLRVSVLQSGRRCVHVFPLCWRALNQLLLRRDQGAKQTGLALRASFRHLRLSVDNGREEHTLLRLRALDRRLY